MKTENHMHPETLVNVLKKHVGDNIPESDWRYLDRAVNSHEELLAAAKLMKRMMKDNLVLSLEQFKFVSSAIRKAEGE